MDEDMGARVPGLDRLLVIGQRRGLFVPTRLTRVRGVTAVLVHDIPGMAEVRFDAPAAESLVMDPGRRAGRPFAGAEMAPTGIALGR